MAKRADRGVAKQVSSLSLSGGSPPPRGEEDQLRVIVVHTMGCMQEMECDEVKMMGPWPVILPYVAYEASA